MKAGTRTSTAPTTPMSGSTWTTRPRWSRPSPGNCRSTTPPTPPAIKANAAALTERLTALDAELKTTLAPVKDRPFVVFHDAYHYLEERYGLNAVGAITVSPDQRPSAQRLSQLRAKISSLDAACVFAEPQFEPTLVATVVEKTPAKRGTLDPLGASLDDGPELYFTLMRGMAASLVSCLKAG